MDERSLQLSGHLAAEVAPVAEAVPQIVFGNIVDHRLAYELMRSAGQAASWESFLGWLDEPSYDPANRIVARLDGRTVAHVHLLFRNAWFGGVRLPVAGFIDFAVSPEYRHSKLPRRMLAAAENAMRDEGAILAITRTDHPADLAATGWLIAKSQGCTRANSRDILSHLIAQQTVRRRLPPIHVRLWRKVELDALMPVYRSAVQLRWGAIDRNEPYWLWLMGRKAYHSLLVALDYPDTGGEPHRADRILGYAVTRGPDVVELFCDGGDSLAGPLLLARTCEDAIERDHHTITLQAPIDDPLHELLVTAGGTWCAAECKSITGTIMVKLLDPVRWIESLYPVLAERAKHAHIQRPCEINFLVGSETYRLRLTRRSSRLERGVDGPAAVTCSPKVFSALLAGNCDVAEAQDDGALQLKDNDTARKLAALFPTELFWQSPFDLLHV